MLNYKANIVVKLNKRPRRQGLGMLELSILLSFIHISNTFPDSNSSTKPSPQQHVKSHKTQKIQAFCKALCPTPHFSLPKNVYPALLFVNDIFIGIEF